MAIEVEGLRLNGAALESLLLPEFVKKLKDSKLGMEFVSLVLVKEEGDDKNKIVVPFILNHQNPKEIQDKVLHMSGAKEKDLNELSKIIKDINKIK